MIRAMVATASTGYAPTLVSPESMSASAPSSTALATSEASARVGRGALIIDSSIWVATMTGLAARRASLIARFCTSGTCSSGNLHAQVAAGHHDPVERGHDLLAARPTAWGFSILAMSGRRTPASSMILRAGSASSGPRTNDSATRSTPQPPAPSAGPPRPWRSGRAR